MNKTTLKIGTLGFFVAMLLSVTMAASASGNVSGSAQVNSTTTIHSNSSGGGGLLNVNVSANAGGNSSNSGIFVSIGNSISGGLHSVATFFSNIWISIKADLHL